MSHEAQQSKADFELNEGDFMRLFVHHEPALRAYARSILPNWDAVDDALQEASVTMWQKREQLEDESGFLPWSKVIVRFKCLSSAASSQRRGPMLSSEVLEMLADSADDTVTSDRVTEVRKALAKCMDQFSKSHQQLLLAPYAGEGQVKQLADRSGKSANAFYKMLGRLREKLSQCVRQRLGEVAL